VKDLARSATALAVYGISANSRQILRGLAATQDDVNGKTKLLAQRTTAIRGRDMRFQKA
jgi:hypothetical protein